MERVGQFFLKPNTYYIGNEISKICSIDIHIHNSFEIFLAKTSNIKYFIEGNSYKMDKGDIIITNTSEIHRPVVVDSTPFGRQFILFNPLYIKQQISDISPLFNIFTNRKKGYFNILKPNKEEREYTEILFEKIAQSYKSNNNTESLLTTLLISELIIILNKIYKYCYSDSETTSLYKEKNPRIKSIIDDLNINFRNSIKLTDLANRHNMDKYYMCHLFKNETSFTIKEYINIQRIIYCKDQIEIGMDSFSEIARLSGFDDYSNFFKTFKKITGESPSSFRKSYVKS